MIRDYFRVLMVDLATGTCEPGAIAADDFEPEAEICNALVLGVRQQPQFERRSL